MERNKRQGILLGTALLGVGTVLGFSTGVNAAPRNDVNQERREANQARNAVKQERQDVRRADTPAERRQEQRELNAAQRDLRNERQDVQQARAQQERREENREHNGNWNQHRDWDHDNDHRWDNNRGYNNGYNPNYNRYPTQPSYGYYPAPPTQPYYGTPAYGYPTYNAPAYGYPAYNPNTAYGYPRQGSTLQSFTGVVTNVRSAQSFDIRIGNDTFNVYLDNVVPRQLNPGDYVRVDGVRTDNNDIRYASVRVLNNR